MATIIPTVTDVSEKGDSSALKIVWTPMANGDVGREVHYPKHNDKSVHVSGTFGTGGSVAVEGSNNGAVSFAALRSPDSNTIAITAEAIKAVLENTDFTRPHVTAGDGTTALTVSMLFHFSNPARQ